MHERRKNHKDRLSAIRLLLMDVDGVLTDGTLAYTEEGQETKTFSARDGLGIRMLHANSIRTGVVTGRSSLALLRRCRELGISLIYDSIRDKGGMLAKIIEETGCSPETIAFIGDDLVDLPLLRQVGLAVAVADAHEIVRAHAHVTTTRGGGKGAVREVCEMLLKAQGLWQETLQQWM